MYIYLYVFHIKTALKIYTYIIYKPLKYVRQSFKLPAERHEIVQLPSLMP